MLVFHQYEYECERCGHRFEAYHPATELIDACERCSGEVRRVFHPVGIIFKGSGFHVTDYRKPEKRAADEPKKEPARRATSKDQDSD